MVRTAPVTTQLYRSLTASIAEVVVLFCGHVQRGPCPRGYQNKNQENAVLQVREVKRVPESENLELFGVLSEGNLILIDGLVTALAHVIVLHVARQTYFRGVSVGSGLGPYFPDVLVFEGLSHELNQTK